VLQDGILVRASGLATFDSVDDPLVVGSDKEVDVGVAFVNCKQEAELDCDELGPSNITAILVPSWGKGPSVPLSVKNDANAP
jgi:hypothetical protein